MSILRRITNLFHRSKLDEEIDAELRSHIEMRYAQGVSHERFFRFAPLLCCNSSTRKPGGAIYSFGASRHARLPTAATFCEGGWPILCVLCAPKRAAKGGSLNSLARGTGLPVCPNAGKKKNKRKGRRQGICS